MNAVWQDILYGLRIWSKKPILTTVAALSLALGIGLNTAIFTLINTMIWGSLPWKAPERIAVIWSVPPQHRDQLDYVSIPDYVALKERNRSFQMLGAVTLNEQDFGAAENGMPAERIVGEEFSPELLQALGVQPLMGRLFTPAEDEIDHPAPVVVLSYRLWQRRFAGDKNILTRTVLINGTKTNIIGVMRPDFRFSDDRAEYLAPLPLSHFQLRGSGRYLMVAGRLKPGVTIEQAQADVEPIAAPACERVSPRHGTGKTVGSSRANGSRGAVRFHEPAAVALAGRGRVRVADRVRERGCAAAGAGVVPAERGCHPRRSWRQPGPHLSQFIIESLILSIFGGVLGVLLAWSSVRILVAMAPPWFPRLQRDFARRPRALVQRGRVARDGNRLRIGAGTGTHRSQHSWNR